MNADWGIPRFTPSPYSRALGKVHVSRALGAHVSGIDDVDHDLTPVADSAAPSMSPSPGRRAAAVLPSVLAIVFFVAFSIVVLHRAEKMIEPDPYAYRASIAALENGDLTLDQQQYDALSLKLQATSLGGGIMQWHQNDDGQWVSEKNPGYPFLAVGFDEIGALRLAPLFYGALACLAMWFGARRWLGRWGGTFAVGAYCSTALAMIMAWRSTMPTFTDASLVATGLGLLIWSAVAVDRSLRARTIVGAAAFFSFGLAVFVRYTNIVVLAVAALFALALCLRPIWRLGWTTLVWWALAALPPIIASLAYNAMVFDGPFSTGYKASTVQFSSGAIPDNLRLMPGRLWQAMPVFVIGLVSIGVLLVVQITHALRSRRSSDDAVEPPGEAAVAASPATDIAPTSTTVDRWIGALLVLTWAAIWATYSAYEWTTRMGVGPAPGSGRNGPAGIVGGLGGAMGAIATDSTQTVYSTVRFYLPALGAIALLVAWLLTRLPAVIGVVLLIALFLFGTHEFLDVSGDRWASTPMGGGGDARSGQVGPGPSGGPEFPGAPSGPNGSGAGSRGSGGPPGVGGAPSPIAPVPGATP